MITFEVKDMTCGHCARTITQAIEACDVAARVQIDLTSHRVQIEPGRSAASQLRDAIEEAGYTPVAARAAPAAAAGAGGGGGGGGCGCRGA